MDYADVFEAFPPGRLTWHERRPGYSAGRDQRIIGPLLSLILNEYSGGAAIPRSGVPLTWRMCRRYGMKRAAWGALRRFVFPRRGYLTRGSGGKLTVVLAHDRAVRFVRKAREAGKIGGVPHPLDPDPQFFARGSNTRQHKAAVGNFG